MHKVLIVENNPVFLELLVHFFEVEGCTTITAKDGLSALNILEDFNPNIVVTDLIMPKISGDQLCRIIRKTSKVKDVFLVVLSSVISEDEIKFRDLEADLYFAKGSKFVLHTCVLEILEKYKKGIRRQVDIIRKEKPSPIAITQELLSARHHYETFFANLADAIVELNFAGQIVQANKSAAALFNIETNALLGNFFTDHLSGAPLTDVLQWITTIPRNAPSSFLSSYKTPLIINQTPVLVHLMSIVEGDDIYVIGICQDITERKHTEQQLQKTHEYLQAKNKEIEEVNTLLSSTLGEYELIFDNGHLGIMIFSDGNKLSRCNMRLAEIFKYTSPDELSGMQMENIHLSPESSTVFKSEYHEKIQNDTMERVEYQLRKKDGSSVWCLLSIKALDTSTPADLSKGVVWIVDDISERKLFEQTIRHQAHYDSLTGLPNRRHLHTVLDQEISRATRHAQHGALLYIDLDNFKTINDSLGHSSGDKLLKLVAEQITNNIRKEDITSRMGGDEFVIILPNLGDHEEIAAKKSQETAEKICALFSTPLFVDKQELHITLSIGISLFPSAGAKVEDILKQADTAMYRAKSAGRNTVCFFLPSMQTTADNRLRLNTEIRTAIQQNQLSVYYQPQVDVDSAIVGAEALIRWNHPSRGFISPAEFIPIAEETGIIKDIGYWVLRNACNTVKKWEQSNLLNSHQSIAINFSPREFSAPDFVDRIVNTLNETKVNPSYLHFELTEGSLVSSVTDTVKKIKKLRQLGFKFSIDDFGTGYSSLSYLQKLPLNTLKIDQSFVSDISNEKSDSIIIDTIIMMAQNLGLEVIAEGVEKKEEITYLHARGCNIYQGYYFCKPIDENSFTELLKSGVCRT